MTTRPAGLAEALAAFQSELPKIAKGSTANAGTYSYQYADLSDVSAAVLPLLGKHGLSFSAKPTLDESGRFVLAYTLRHSGGDSDSGAYPLPSSGNPQQIGSAITYARRYALLAVTGVAPGGEDDDGASAPAADRRPVERHEHSYDPAEQEALRDGYEQEIEAAKTGDEITEIGTRVRSKRASGDLSPATYQHLADAAARRRAELDALAKSNADFAAAQASGKEPATVLPSTDSPTRRDQQLAAMDRKVAQRKAAADATP